MLLMILAVVLVLAGILLIVLGIVSPLPLIAGATIGALLVLAGLVITMEMAGKK